LHGFNSSPASIKGQQLGRAIAVLPIATRPTYFLPQLHHRPQQAVRDVSQWVDTRRPKRLTFVGSSLGGFYATNLAERYGARAVLINPALHPYQDLAPYLGPQRNLYTGEEYELTAEHFAQLMALRVPRITRPERYLLLVQTGDEILDYRAALSYYAGAWQFVQGGGDHGYRGFEEQIPMILRFGGIANGCHAFARG